MNHKILALSAALLFGTGLAFPSAVSATVSADEQVDLLKQKKAEEAKIAVALKRKKAIEAKLKAAEDAKRKAAAKDADKRKKLSKTKDTKVDSQSAGRKPHSCDSFLSCLFGKRRDGSNFDRRQYGQFASSSQLSTRTTRRTVGWDESKYPVGSLIVRTPERALYYVSAEGEAIRYRVGVGREGFQWSGQSRIIGKQEWPGWTPPQEMIEREAEKGHEIPPFMEGGPGNPLGARALYIGGTIFRVHGTNNESSIGGAVSSGCIRMMNADVIDLYNRVKVGSRIYVYQ
jgi:lipoprotein-anchoring transpeptidase ErfK/SrfK